jgi:hypothetical protein
MISAIAIHYRHSQRLILSGTKSARGARNIWLMRYKITQWVTFSTHRYHFCDCHSLQTLTTLVLASNRISDGGAQHLANALQNNTVSHIFHSSISFLRSFFTIDTHNARSSVEWNRRWRHATSGQCVTKEYSESHFQLIDIISTIIFQYRHSQR